MLGTGVRVDACSGRAVGVGVHWLTGVNTSTCNTQLLCVQSVEGMRFLSLLHFSQEGSGCNVDLQGEGGFTVQLEHSSRLAPVSL